MEPFPKVVHGAFFVAVLSDAQHLFFQVSIISQRYLFRISANASNNNNYNQALIYFSQLASDSTEALHECSNASRIHWYSVHTKVIKTLRMITNIPIAKSCFCRKCDKLICKQINDHYLTAGSDGIPVPDPSRTFFQVPDPS